jgi:gamma-glutamyltranspeptidase/glutathione hydrolase
MRRRQFLQTLPAAAAGAAMLPGVDLDAQNANGAPSEAELPKFQAAGQERFIRPDVHAGDRPAGASFATRSAAMGLNGAAGTAHPLATQTAIDILKRGGSAADAAVAANAVLGFVEPTSSGLGGDCYAFVWDPKTQKLEGMASSGASPKGLSLETVQQRSVVVDGKHVIPPNGAVSVSVPGALGGWWALHERYGKLKWAELFEPAIHACENGSPVPQIIGRSIKANVAAFLRPGAGVEETQNMLHTYAPGGRAPNEGEVRRNPDLAKTYRMIAEGGRDAFYDGPIADTIEKYFKRIGGWMTRADLAAHKAVWPTPLESDYRGVTVYAMGENTQGLATLEMLNIIEQFDMRGYGFQSPEALQVMIEAKRLAYEDRARYYADPRFSKVPVEWLNSKEYAKERAKQIKLDSILTWRHYVLHDCRQGRDDGVDHPVKLPRHGFGTRTRRFRFYVSRPRRTVLSAAGTPEHLCSGQAAFPDDHSWIRGEERQAMDQLWRDGRRYAAAGTDADHREPRGLRAGCAGSQRQPSVAPRGLVAVDGRGPPRTGAEGHSAAGGGRAEGDARQAHRSRMADGRERRRLRSLRVHRGVGVAV